MRFFCCFCRVEIKNKRNVIFARRDAVTFAPFCSGWHRIESENIESPAARFQFRANLKEFQVPLETIKHLGFEVPNEERQRTRDPIK